MGTHLACFRNCLLKRMRCVLIFEFKAREASIRSVLLRGNSSTDITKDDKKCKI